VKNIERIDRIKVLMSQVHQRSAFLLRRENIDLGIKKKKLENTG